MNTSRYVGIAVVIIVFSISAYISTLNELPIPGRVIAGVDYLEPPWTFFISGSFICIGITIALMVVGENKYRAISTTLFVVSFVLFFIGTILGEV